MEKITEIEGIGQVYGGKLAGIGINTIEQLLEGGASRPGRGKIANEAEIDESLVLSWVNKADLCRIKGVASEISDLLEASGVDTIKELRHRNAENLYAKMNEVNDQKSLVRRMPSQDQVHGFIDQAKSIEPKVTY